MSPHSASLKDSAPKAPSQELKVDGLVGGLVGHK